MKTEVNTIGLEFCAKVLEVAKELDNRALLYWSRKEKELLALLETKETFEPVTSEKIDPYIIPALPATTRKALYNKRLISSSFLDTVVDNLALTQPGTTPVQVYKSALHVHMTKKELFTEMGIVDAEELRNSCFTYSQVAWLASRHGKIPSKKHTLLSFDKTNYFPYINKKGEVKFIGMFSRKEFKDHKKWEAWFETTEWKGWLHEGYLFLSEDVRDLSQM